jgi:hypothetical protein
VWRAVRACGGVAAGVLVQGLPSPAGALVCVECACACVRGVCTCVSPACVSAQLPHTHTHAHTHAHTHTQEVGCQVLGTAATTAAAKLAAAAAAVGRIKGAALAEGVADLRDSPADAPDALLSLQTGGRCCVLLCGAARLLVRSAAGTHGKNLCPGRGCSHCRHQPLALCSPRCSPHTHARVWLCVCVPHNAGARRVHVLLAAGSSSLARDKQLTKTCQVGRSVLGCLVGWLVVRVVGRGSCAHAVDARVRRTPLTRHITHASHIHRHTSHMSRNHRRC